VVRRRRPDRSGIEQPERPLKAAKRRPVLEQETAARIAIARRAKPSGIPGYVRLLLTLELRRELAEKLSLRAKQPHVSALMRNRSGVFSVERLMEFLTDLGQDVQITVRPTRKEHGKMSVVVAA